MGSRVFYAWTALYAVWTGLSSMLTQALIANMGTDWTRSHSPGCSKELGGARLSPLLFPSTCPQAQTPQCLYHGTAATIGALQERSKTTDLSMSEPSGARLDREAQ